jgi:4-amino-4-deoxy-L-arabinose transferase-like glycosyltransferase
MDTLSSRYRAVLFLCLVVSTIAFQGSRGLYETTEGRYAECVRQTLSSGTWDAPVLNGAHHWSKPPLTYMCIAAGLLVFGDNAWGVRAYLVLAFLCTVVSVYYLGMYLWGKDAASFSALIYGTSLFTMAGSNMVSTDTLLTLWESLVMLTFWCGIRTKQNRVMVLMWFFLGLAFFTKGPVGLFPLLGIFPVYYYMRRRGSGVPKLFVPIGLLVFVAVGLGWYFVEGMRHQGLIRYWVLDEIIKRNVEGEFHRNPGWYFGFLIYIPGLCLGALPWVGLILIKGRHLPWHHGKWLRGVEWQNRIEWIFLILSVVLPLTIFMLSTSKLILYVLPLFIPISLAMGKATSWLVAHNRLRLRTVILLACCSMLFFAGGKALSARLEFPNDMKQLLHKITPLLKAYPEHQLYVYDRKGRPLNGLQFYMTDIIPVIDVKAVRSLAKRSDASQAVPLVLTRTKYLPSLKKAVGIASFRVEKIDSHWAFMVPLQEPETTP